MTTWSVDPKWAEDQLDKAGLTARTQQARNVRESVMLLVLQFNSEDYGYDHKMQVLELFNKLAKQHELVGRDATDPGARWSEFKLGDVNPGATVRVRDEAYAGDAGNRHNGMVGKFVAARGGEAVVQYHGSPDGTGARHRPEKLEVLKK